MKTNTCTCIVRKFQHPFLVHRWRRQWSSLTFLSKRGFRFSSNFFWVHLRCICNFPTRIKKKCTIFSMQLLRVDPDSMSLIEMCSFFPSKHIQYLDFSRQTYGIWVTKYILTFVMSALQNWQLFLKRRRRLEQFSDSRF